MKRFLLSLVALIATVIGVFWPLVANSASSGDETVDTAVITDYRADYALTRDGELAVDETLTVDLPEGKHGIFQFWDVSDADPENKGVRYEPRDIRITMDGQAVPFELGSEEGGKFETARIGDADTLVSPGEHVYRVSYRIADTIADGDPGRFIWRVVGNGWRMRMERSTSTVHFPEAPTSFACSTNNGTACQVSEPDPATRVVTTGPLEPNVGVAVKADLPFPGPGRAQLPWSVSMDPILGTSKAMPIVIVLLSLLTFAGGFYWMWRSREHAPLLPVMYEPPADPQNQSRKLGPVQTYYVAYEDMPKKALVSTLFHLAEQGHVRLDRTSNKDWTVISQLTPERFASLDPAANAVVAALGLSHEGSTFTADGSKNAGLRLSTATKEMDAATANWGTGSGALRVSRSELAGRVVVAAAVVVAAVLMIFQLLPGTIMALPFAAFAVGGAGLYVAGVGTRRTRLGREVWSRAGGFERLLSTTSNRERLDFSARKDLFTSYIPYAMAFDCADAWAAKYRYATGQEPPDPIWFPGFYIGSSHALFGGTGSGMDSFESSLSSSLSAYSSSQSSSGGGGGFGGGFGGGGGGGGGGGSW
ncbi:DUF2207 domain-containing protein [Gordonia sihwensis]|uniref:DUF2207 domain-containing protein n=1 Tax=Gordonia TaxID=2053 RepID=UPI00241806DE|nr:DUF2207 domain-containing protein [Gordonia sihwensis]WFN92925.1 DUF2207 domain-containing protein [Gordonia sihwensis]